MALNASRIAAAFQALADAFAEDQPGKFLIEWIQPEPTGSAPAAAPAKRGRGRPVKGEGEQVTAVAASAAVVEADPFATAPSATIEQVREALTALKAATSQENAVAVLKSAGGADNLPSLDTLMYGTVVAAAKAAVAAAKAAAPAAPVPVDDPFAIPETAPVVAAKPLTREDIRALAVETGKRTSQDTVQKIVMKHGGKAPIATGGEGPSLLALPESAYAAVAAELKALPSTK